MAVLPLARVWLGTLVQPEVWNVTLMVLAAAVAGKVMVTTRFALLPAAWVTLVAPV